MARDVTLRSLVVENIRGFQGEHIVRLHELLTVLVGRNNVGKSTILRIPALVSQLSTAMGSLQLYGPFLRSGSETARIGLGFRFPATALGSILGNFPSGGVHVHPPLNVRFTPPADGHTQLLTREHVKSFLGLDEAVPLDVDFSWTKVKEEHRLDLRVYGQVNGGLRVPLRFTNSSLEHFEDPARPAVHGMLAAPLKGSMAPGLPLEELWKAARAIVASSEIASWNHGEPHFRKELWGQSRRRLQNDDEEDLKQVLTFLKVKHDEKAFRPLRDAVIRAFPEFSDLTFLEANDNPYVYRPYFALGRGASPVPLTRDLLGSGSWSFLAILTAARAAKATGARTMFLDEPHLYLHPGLERRLIHELTDPSFWDGNPLQLVVSTHSPVFIDAAWRLGQVNILDWSDRDHTCVRVHDATAMKMDVERDSPRFWTSLVSSPSELLYAERVVFVEGDSDVSALRALVAGRHLSNEPLRFEPLLRSDKFVKKDLLGVLTLISRTRRGGFLSRPILVLDSDKKEIALREWGKASEREDPSKNLRVVFVGKEKNDIESAFCDRDFLVRYLEKLAPDTDGERIRSSVEGALKQMADLTARRSELSADEKGSAVIRQLRQEFLGEKNEARNKAAILDELVEFYVVTADSEFTRGVRENLAPLERVLRTPDEEP